MAIENFNEAQLEEVLANHFSPSQEIRDPERLIGREKYLTQIRRALASPGRHVFIYGERGVGKTSLAMTAGKVAATEDKNFIYFACGQDTTFYEVIAAIVKSTLDDAQAIDSTGTQFGFGINVLGNGGNFNLKKGDKKFIPVPTNNTEVIDLLRYLRSSMEGQIVIVVDELDRIRNKDERTKFAELIKNVGTTAENVRFILCGIGANVDELIGEHLSTGRMFEPIEVSKLSPDNLWKIIEVVAQELSVEVTRGQLIRVGIISDGFPHYVHLIGQCIFYEMHDDAEAVSVCSDEHLLNALKEATKKAEPSLKRIYQTATEKTKNKRDYEEALWALADKTETRRQIKDVFESSYLRVHKENKVRNPEGAKERLTKDQLNNRMLRLREESHASVVMGHGSGWFSFRENVVRGYVRLMAETNGVELVRELTD